MLLVANLRTQLEALNKIEFTDSEWERFFMEKIASKNEGIVEKTARIQEDHVQVLKRDDGTSKNVYLIDKKNIHNNRLQAINQYEVAGAYKNRYDVTILVNGLPLVHVELKRRGIDIREAFNQINRYQRDSFWAESGLFDYVQLFVISNGTLTKYYSNTTRDSHLTEQVGDEAGQAAYVGLVRVHHLVGRRLKYADHRPDRVHCDVLRQAHAAQHLDEVLRLRCRPQAIGDAALPGCGGRADLAAHRGRD